MKAKWITIAAGVLAASGASTAVAEPDYSKLPPDTRRLAKMTQDAKFGLVAAVTAAENETKAKAVSAELVRKDAGAIVLVRLVGNDKLFDVTVDAASGSILDKKDSELTAPVIPGEAVSGEPVTLPSGVQFYDIKVGSGDSPSTPAHLARYHTTGYLVDGRKFWSSLDSGQTLDGPVGNYVRGMQEGLMTMKPGGKRKILIPYELGYGEAGKPPTIPRRAMLVFDIELIAVAPPGGQLPAPTAGAGGS